MNDLQEEDCDTEGELEEAAWELCNIVSFVIVSIYNDSLNYLHIINYIYTKTTLANISMKIGSTSQNCEPLNSGRIPSIWETIPPTA